MADIKPITPQERAILDYIGKFESKGGDYDILYGGYKGGSDKKLTDMTIREVLSLQDKMKSSGSSAVGANQIINPTLLEEIKKNGYNLDERFSPDMQDTIIINRLNRRRGLDDFLRGEKTIEEFGLELSKEFASIPNPQTGKSYYDKDEVGNKSLTNVDDVFANLTSIKDMATDFPDWNSDGNNIEQGDTIENNRTASVTDPVVDNPMDQWADPSDEGKSDVQEYAGIEDEASGPSGDIQGAQQDRGYKTIFGGSERGIDQLTPRDVKHPDSSEIPKHVIDNSPVIPASPKAKKNYLVDSASTSVNNKLHQYTRAGIQNKFSQGGFLNNPPVKQKGEGTLAFYKRSNEYKYGGKVNKYYDGGNLNGPGDPVKGDTSATTITGPTQVNRSITATTGANGLPSSTRTTTRTTPTNTRMETPYTQEGNDAYANLDQSGRDAQDKAWTAIQNKSGSNTSTETEEATQLGMQPLGINFAPAGLPTGPSESIQKTPTAPARAPMYHVGGSNIHNMPFGGHSNTMITSDASIQPDKSFTTSPGDISTDSPMSGRRNTAYRNQLTPLQQDAAETTYGSSWNSPIPDDTATEMLRREQVGTDKIQERATKQHNQYMDRKDAATESINAKTNERAQVVSERDAQRTAKINALKTKNAAKLASRQNQNAYGGPTGQMSQDPNNTLVEFEGGGTHAQNPLGGIPQGMGDNGKMNTVEAEETKYKFKDGDYVFSNRIKL